MPFFLPQSSMLAPHCAAKIKIPDVYNGTVKFWWFHCSGLEWREKIFRQCVRNQFIEEINILFSSFVFHFNFSSLFFFYSEFPGWINVVERSAYYLYLFGDIFFSNEAGLWIRVRSVEEKYLHNLKIPNNDLQIFVVLELG